MKKEVKKAVLSASIHETIAGALKYIFVALCIASIVSHPPNILLFLSYGLMAYNCEKMQKDAEESKKEIIALAKDAAQLEKTLNNLQK